MSTFPFPWNPDHYSGFVAKPEEYDFKFLGEKQMLAPMHAEYSPEHPCATDGGASACAENWEMRHLTDRESFRRRSAGPVASL
jgi:hypothetical protein